MNVLEWNVSVLFECLILPGLVFWMDPDAIRAFSTYRHILSSVPGIPYTLDEIKG